MHPQPTATWDVFLAYASPDRDRARTLHAALTALGLRVCFDEVVLHPGDDWHLLLPSYVHSAAIVAVLVSPASQLAHYQRSEVIAAVEAVRGEGRRLVPVRLEPDAPLPYGTEQLQAIDMLTDSDADYVARRIAALVPRTDTAPPADRVFCDRVPRVSRFLTGREALLARLAADARGNGTTTVVTQAIQGMGGVGKTTAAAAFAESRRHEVDVVWWVRAEEPALLVADLAELAPHVGAPASDDPVRAAALVRRQLESTDRSWLVVFDNVPDQQAVEEWIPRRGRGSVLVTSRSTSFPLAAEVVRVDTLPPDVAERFLRHRVEHANPDAAAEDLGPVVERLGGLPLALEQAGAWVAQVPNRRFARFVELYDDAARDPFPDGTRPSGYDHTATTTWRLSLRAATAEAPEAERVLAVLSHMAPDGFPCQWLRDMGDDEYFRAASADAVGEALDALHVYSLATISPDDTIGVHRVIQAVTRRSAPPGAAAAAIRTLLRKASDDPFSHYWHWRTLTVLTPHALAVAETAGGALPASAGELCRLLNSVSPHQFFGGAVRDGLATATRAHDLAVTHLGPEHHETLKSRSCIAHAHHTAGNVRRAISLFEALLHDAVRVLGDDHPTTLNIRNSLGSAHQSVGEYERTIALHADNLPRYQRVLGTAHHHTLVGRNNLAKAHLLAGNVDRAVPMMAAVLADFERLLGPDHPQTLIARNNVGQAHLAAGDCSRAIAVFESTLADRRRLLGDHHPQTLTTCHDLAGAYLAAGDLDRAIGLYETTLADRRRVMGDDHPQTLGTSHDLAGAYLAAGDLDRAITLYESTLADRRRVLGNDHHLTLATYTALTRAMAAAEGGTTRD